MTGTGATFGTAFYMSPEQARGAGEVDPRTDVWSLGVVLYELLSGRKPFVGEQFLEVIHQILSFDPTPLATLRPGLPPKVVAAVESAMKKDSAQRLSSVAALAEVLAPFAGVRWGSEPSHAAPPMAPTLATPATQVGLSKGVGELGVQASVARRPESRAPATSRGPARKIVLAVGAAVALTAVIALTLSRRPGENAAPLGAPPSPKPTIDDRRTEVLAPAPRPATTPSTLPTPTASPASPPGPTPHVRTASEHSKPGSNRHATHPSSTLGPSAAPPQPVASPAPPLDKPTRSHRIEIDKDDPFGP